LPESNATNMFLLPKYIQNLSTFIYAYFLAIWFVLKMF
jgi:hypothetical protein